MSNIKVIFFEENRSENINFIYKCEGNVNVEGSLNELLKVYDTFDMIFVSIYGTKNSNNITYIFQATKDEAKNYIIKNLKIFNDAKIYVRKNGCIRVMYYFADKQ